MDTTQKLATRLRTEGDRFARFFSSLDQDQWRSEIYTEGSVWTIRNVLSHFVTAERGFIKLFEDIRQGGNGASEDFSIDRFNASQQIKMEAKTPDELLVDFRDVRNELCQWVEALSENDLEKIGRHPYLGQVSLLEMIKMVYLHNQIHLRDIHKVVKKEPI